MAFLWLALLVFRKTFQLMLEDRCAWAFDLKAYLGELALFAICELIVLRLSVCY